MNDFDDSNDHKRRFNERDARRAELSLQRRRREIAKREKLQAELDAMKPTNPDVEDFAKEYAGRARGAKCGAHIGGGARSASGW